MAGREAKAGETAEAAEAGEAAARATTGTAPPIPPPTCGTRFGLPGPRRRRRRSTCSRTGARRPCTPCRACGLRWPRRARPGTGAPRSREGTTATTRARRRSARPGARRGSPVRSAHRACAPCRQQQPPPVRALRHGEGGPGADRQEQRWQERPRAWRAWAAAWGCSSAARRSGTSLDRALRPPFPRIGDATGRSRARRGGRRRTARLSRGRSP